MCGTLNSSGQHFQVEKSVFGILAFYFYSFLYFNFHPQPRSKNQMPSIWGNQEIVLIFCFMTQTHILLAAMALFLPAHSLFIATGVKIFQNSM